jgi:signal peptidase I
MRIFRSSIETVGALIKALIIAGFIVLFIVQISVVHGHSMEPNIHPKQRIVIEKASYRFHEPQRGDIVVIELPGSNSPLIKRVIGLEGETVEIRDDQVYIDGRLLNESYLTNIQQADYGPTAVPVEHVFVMGDNRPYSRDSRAFGPVDIFRITGRAWFSMWPIDEFGAIEK